jgi:hypothetical protein
MDHPIGAFRQTAIVALGAALALAACGKPAPPAAPPPTPPAAANTAAPAAPDTADAADAKAFLDGLYAHYKTSKNNNFQMFDANVREVFDPATIQLLNQDTKALNGDLGVIDGDWLCDCQDFVSLKATVAVQSASPTDAKATADFTDTGMPGQGARHAAFDLVKVNGAWRIHDITDQGEASLRSQLSDEIKSLAKGPKKSDPNVAP